MIYKPMVKCEGHKYMFIFNCPVITILFYLKLLYYKINSYGTKSLIKTGV